MILNYHTLHRWVEEVTPDIAGAKIVEIFTQSKDVLTIGLVTISRQQCAMEVSAETGIAHIVLRKNYHRKSKNSVDLFGEITKQKIKQILLDTRDRIIHITLMDESELMIELFGAVNVFHLDKTRVVKNSFKDSKSYTGQALEERPVKDIHRINIDDFSDFSSHIRTSVEFSAKLSEGLGHFNKFLAMECLHDVSGQKKPYDVLQNVVQRLKTEKPRIYWIYDEPKLFSLIHLAYYCEKHPEIREEIFDSVNDAVQIYIAKKTSFRQKEKKLQELLRAIKIRIKKNQSLAASLAEERREAEGFELLERKAQLLNLHVPEIRRGMRDITVQNIYVEDQAPITIELNPELTPQKNVEYYFSLSKKMKSSVKKVGDRIRVLADETENLTRLKKEFENGETRDWKKIDKKYDEFVHAGWVKKISAETRTKIEKEAPTFREFVVPGNWRVFVGQNDTKNDQLTFKFAKSDDYWFHARGVPGSHVVLKRDGRKDNPGKQAIETTASIAAFFSKAKSSSLVPVAYTLKKYVRKRKGSRPGQVIIEREEVVIVPPKDFT
ncbi:DUF814 domain-containing protein [bacterium]|nr:MAG: DUF814 domain-containing protein [bacterium]